MWGEFDVLDPTCNVDRRWVLKELRELIGFSFNCDWSRFTSNGCSVPLHDPVSILVKIRLNCKPYKMNLTSTFFEINLGIYVILVFYFRLTYKQD